jgi:uncharacterized membrane protein (UPF0136 family)
MKPVHAIWILALVGGIVGYAIFRSTQWLGTGIILGFVVAGLFNAARKATRK